MKRGFGLIAIIMVVAIIAAGGAFYFSGFGSGSQSASDNEIYENAIEKAEDVTEKMNADDMSDSSAADGEFVGDRLAGGASPLLDFAQSDYEKATASGKLVVLYFYATWCPICKEELPHLYGAFDELAVGDAIGFRVNFNDGDTDKDEEALAREFGVAYQHTKVFVKNGERILKAPDSWDKARYFEEIGKAL
ncbi:thioredoxin family protein [bacterium]|nr:thioredoxin family protein [bacterium]MCI0680403.1 thioredoxin family protein [bacterium]